MLPEHLTVARNIRTARRARRMRQEDLAVAIGVSRPLIAHYELARRRPTARNLTAIAATLRITPAQLADKDFQA